jgi:hypothetical protein
VGCVSKATYESLQAEVIQLKEDNKILEESNLSLEEYTFRLEKELKLYKETFGEVYEDVQPPYEGAKSMNIKNNPDAANPSWEQLVAFLEQDTTEKIRYWDFIDIPKYGYYTISQLEEKRKNELGIPENETPENFVCCEFANLLHDNAEANGIKAAVVAIHATGEDYAHLLNAFETTDMGLVYIDCTGAEDCNGFDKVSYIKKGEDAFGFELQDNTLWDNARLLEQKQLWDEYNTGVEQCYAEFEKIDYYKWMRFPRKVELRAVVAALTPTGGALYVPAEAYYKLALWSERLLKLSEQLIPIFEIKGTVTKVEIYW